MQRRPISLVAPLVLLSVLAVGACSDRPTALEPERSGAIGASPLFIPDPGTYTRLDGLSSLCAVRTDGVVRCWTSTSTYERTAAVGVFVAAATEAGPSGCALRSDGAVECWGNTHMPPLVTPPAGTVFVEVGSGITHGCGLRSDGVIQCWGRDDTGEAQPTLTATNGVFVGLGVRADISCGLTSLGAIECSGSVDPSNQVNHIIWTASSGTFTRLVMTSAMPCGIRTGGDVECHPLVTRPELQPLPGTFVDYSYGGVAHCGLTANGVAFCGGSNSYGDAPPMRTASVGSFTQVRMGFQHACGLRTDRHLECWGVKTVGPFTEVLPTATFTAPVSVIVGQPIALGLTNAQVPGYPQATAFTYAFDCGSGTFASAGSGSTASCPTSATGTLVVRGKVLDEDLSEAVYTANVTVKSAAQGTSDLLGEIQLASLSPDLRKALTAKLNAALAALAKGKTAGACSALNDFINQLNAQRGKAIPAATADGWILTAQQIQGAIGC